MKLHNAPMVKQLLKHFRMEDCKPVSTPLQAGVDLTTNEEKEIVENTPYRQLIGALFHLSNTVRPDIAFSTNYLARFMHNPSEDLWK